MYIPDQELFHAMWDESRKDKKLIADLFALCDLQQKRLLAQGKEIKDLNSLPDQKGELIATAIRKIRRDNVRLKEFTKKAAH